MDLSPVSCEYNYVATAHKPTSVEHSAVGNFTSAHDQNLIISYVLSIGNVSILDT